MLLENNTDLDLKFFNTMGISKNFSSDIIDLRLNFQVKLNVIDTDGSIDQSIKLAVVAFIEAANASLDQRFSTSNLITMLESTITAISYIQLYSINNSNIQNVEAVTNPDLNTVSYVPEFLTVKKLSGTDNFGNSYLYDITITYL